MFSSEVALEIRRLCGAVHAEWALEPALLFVDGADVFVEVALAPRPVTAALMRAWKVLGDRHALNLLARVHALEVLREDGVLRGREGAIWTAVPVKFLVHHPMCPEESACHGPQKPG